MAKLIKIQVVRTYIGIGFICLTVGVGITQKVVVDAAQSPIQGLLKDLFLRMERWRRIIGPNVSNSV